MTDNSDTEPMRKIEGAFAEGIIDWSLRVVQRPDGGLDAYMHPAGKDGETLDFHLTDGGFEFRDDGLGAGSALDYDAEGS